MGGLNSNLSGHVQGLGTGLLKTWVQI